MGISLVIGVISVEVQLTHGSINLSSKCLLSSF
jgi:hypothetical protein